MCLLTVSSIQAQKIDTLQYEQRIATLEQQNASLQNELAKLEQRTKEVATMAEATNEKLASIGTAMEQRMGGLQGKMDSIDRSTAQRMEQTESEVQNTEIKRRNGVLWGIAVAALLAAASATIYLLLHKRINRKGDDIEQLRAKADSLNEQIVQRMDKELAELKQIVDNRQTAGTATPSAEPDHSLVKALADRITFMEMTLYRMDSSVKGHKHLTKSIKSMKDNLLANGYELVEMLGKDYVEGMNASTSFNDDENMEQGKRIITGITKPQINYKGKMIQAAQITVSQNI